MDRKVVSIGVDPVYWQRLTSAQTENERRSIAREGAPVISRETGEILARIPATILEAGIKS